jgi:hypothetical protein
MLNLLDANVLGVIDVDCGNADDVLCTLGMVKDKEKRYKKGMNMMYQAD